MTNVVIAGATSAIAQAVARLYAAGHARLMLIARDEDKLRAVAGDLRARGAEVETVVADLASADAAELARIAEEKLGAIDALLIAHGVLPDQRAIEADPRATIASFEVNAVSAIALATAFAEHFERRNSGVLAFLGSVAGDRGRRSNYVYGAAKAAVQTFFDGLIGRFSTTNVRVIDFKLGFVDTPMTANVRKNPLFASAASVGRTVHRAMTSSRRGVIYVPSFWRWIMIVIRLMPASLIARLRL